MNEEILISITANQQRVAILENSTVQELHVEYQKSRGLLGNIYLGKVQRVLPGMQAAFVDIGLQQAAFLHASELQVTKFIENSEHVMNKLPDINELLQPGQEVLVQVTKEPIDSKGPRLTTEISIPSRLLVYLPVLDHLGVSQRIGDEKERSRLKKILSNLSHSLSGNFILRTAAEGASENDLQLCVSYIEYLWKNMQEKLSRARKTSLIYEDLDLTQRILRDCVNSNTTNIFVDNKNIYRLLTDFANKYIPSIESKIKYKDVDGNLFERYRIEEELEKALARKVTLKSGGHLVIDKTEAMTTIDVNTGGFVGASNLEDTVFKTNLEAVDSIARQLKLRNIGGIIIIDFIDMDDSLHKKKVFTALEKKLAKDHAKCSISNFTSLGLIEMTRKRKRESLQGMLTENCNTCGGSGRIKSAKTVCYEIFRDILRKACSVDAKGYLIMAHQNIIDCLLDEEGTAMADIGQQLSKPLKLQVEPLYNQEQFEVVLM